MLQANEKGLAEVKESKRLRTARVKAPACGVRAMGSVCHATAGAGGASAAGRARLREGPDTRRARAGFGGGFCAPTPLLGRGVTERNPYRTP
ncbi:hypothetical protein GCM10010433_35340 [Streptomyces pulveraceus]